MPAHKIRLAGPWELLQPARFDVQSPAHSPEVAKFDHRQSTPQPAAISGHMTAQRCQLPWRAQPPATSETSQTPSRDAMPDSPATRPKPHSSSYLSSSSSANSPNAASPESSTHRSAATVQLARRFHRPNGLSPQTLVRIRLIYTSGRRTPQSIPTNSIPLSAHINGHLIPLEISASNQNAATAPATPETEINPVTIEVIGQISDVLKPFNQLAITLHAQFLLDPHAAFDMAFLEIVEPPSSPAASEH